MLSESQYKGLTVGVTIMFIGEGVLFNRVPVTLLL